jgi:heme oxygenase
MSEQPLAARLREATHALHRAAERSVFMAGLLQGRIERARYCSLLRNLHALYAALEQALERHAAALPVAPLQLPELFRAGALASDLGCLHGADWSALPLTRAMREYTGRIQQLAAERPLLLVAHAYVRYLGDLSGGQSLRERVRCALALAGDAGTAFYAFGDREAVESKKLLFRAGLDAMRLDATSENELVAEARAAFARHVDLFEELAALADRGAGA